MSRILLLGGSGFIGRHVAQRLVRDQHTVIVPTRGRERAKRDLILLPTVELISADIHDEPTLERLVSGCSAVINLVGVLHSRSGRPFGLDFKRAHEDLPRHLVGACERAGVKRLVHLSALGASADAPSGYLRSKAAGEQALATSPSVAVTVLRPSVVFGPGDRFLSLFAQLLRARPVLPLAMPQARFQPVYVEDVANAVVAALTDERATGQTYDLVGPRVYSLQALVEMVGNVSAHPRPIIGLSKTLSLIQAWMMEWMPGRMLSRDNVYSMTVDSVSDAPLPFGLSATALEAVVPGYLANAELHSRFDRLRFRAARHG